MGGEAAEMTVVRVIQRGEKIADIVNEGKALTLCKEHAVVKLASGERALVSGGQYGIDFGREQITKFTIPK